MTRWKVPDYVRKMRDEGKAGASPLRPWYRSILAVMAHLGWSALQYVFATMRRLSGAIWGWLKGPWRPRVTYIVKSAPAWFLAFAGLYTIFSSFVSMSISDPLSPNDPFSAPITITNASTFFTLVDVEQSCSNNYVRHANATIHEEENSASKYLPLIPELLRGNQDTVFCGGMTGNSRYVFPITGTDITMKISYKLAVYLDNWLVTIPLLSKHTEARFIVIKTGDGKFRGMPFGLKDKDPFNLRSNHLPH